jgi:hypothetical protein
MMENVIYSVSPLQVNLGSLGMIAFFMALGLGGLASAVFGRGQSGLARLAPGAIGVFLLLVGAAMGFVTYRTMTGGVRTAEVRLYDKFVAQDNCGDGGTCARYVLETRSASKFFDIPVDEAAYEKAQIDGCYRLTYYPGGGLLGPAENADTWESISSVLKVELIESSLCE